MVPPEITFTVPFPFALANAAALVTGYILIRAILKIIRG